MARRVLRREEEALWQAFARDVTPLHPARPMPQTEKTASRIGASTDLPTPSATSGSFAAVMASACPRPAARTTELRIGIRAPGLDDTSWKRLSRGNIRVDARLDLHGYIVQEAFDRLHAFLNRARARNWRCVEVVTGLGSGQTSGMIRRELPFWLQREDLRPYVLAVVHSHVANHGSVRILLKNRRRA